MAELDDLLAAAHERTGLTDFGDDSYREGLERLVRSLQGEAKLNAIGEVVLPELIVKHLSHRLQIEDWYTRHPEIDDERIDAPLIGLGLPRTGSTALSILLAEDPNARSLRRWEAVAPCPPPSTVDAPDPRIAESVAMQEMQDQLAPRLAALVPGSPTGPEECQDLMALDFKSHYFQAFAYMPSYSDWLLDADLTSTYLYERRVLKLLQWGSPTRPWRLKCPSHLLWLDHLDTVFPDARFVMTHRDPTEVMVSVVDVYAEVGRQFSRDVDLHYLGRLNVEHWTTGMERLLRFRGEHGDDRFYDMDFRCVQRDPIGQVRGLYAWLGEPVTDDFERGMRAWWEESAERRERNIHPDPAEFGLDLDEVRSLFAAYSARISEWTAK
jgi:Sulfotransferase family